MFLPAEQPNLRKILSYYTASLAVNYEGDVNVNETLHGLGTAYSFLSIIIYSFLSLIISSTNDLIVKPITFTATKSHLHQAAIMSIDDLADSDQPSKPNPPTMKPVGMVPHHTPPLLLDPEMEVEWFTPPSWPPWAGWWLLPSGNVKQQLTEFVPPPGYFISGGVAGVISRTATAPLDRLKVYLIAQTGVKRAAKDAAKSGAPAQAMSLGMRTLGDACKDLWKAGGMRSLFAGKL